MPAEEVLQVAAVRLVKAMARYRLSPTAAAADRVIEARLAVKEAFIAAGWEPPTTTRLAMERDRQLLQEHAGGFEEDSGQDRPDRAERRRTRTWPAPAPARCSLRVSLAEL